MTEITTLSFDPSVLQTLAIIGAAVSVLVQWIKKKYGGGPKTMGILIVLSVLVGTGYYFIQSNAGLLQAILSILAAANLAYNFIWQWFEKPEPKV